VLAILPVLVFFYVLLILPFAGDAGKPRIENIMFWPTLAGIVLALALYNRAHLDKGFFLSPPILSLVAYLMFAGASITWAYNSDYSFSRFSVQLLAVVTILVPYALPIPTAKTVERLHVCCAIAIGLSAFFILTTPPTFFGHAGYFNHKQELGMLTGAAIILSAHGLLLRGWWRRVFAAVAIGLAIWVAVESQSKSPVVLCVAAMAFAALALLVCKALRTTPAFVVGAVVLGYMALSTVWSDPIGRIAWRLYGDSTISGRIFIWDFINYQISHRSWFGWGFHSYWNVPNSPHDQAPGFIKDMISTHSGYLELKLDTGRIGYWLFMVFVYVSLHFLEPVRRKDPLRAWVFLSLASYVLLQNLLESIWMQIIPLWILYLIVVGESLRIGRTANPRTSPVRRSTPLRRRPGALRSGAESIEATTQR
jgi:O-antigen ligase